MALTQVTGPYPIFTDLDGSPLDDGYLYIGATNQDPETNPIQVFWDSALTIPATQPIRTNSGYAYRNGTPALMYTGGQFSITIRNKRQEFVLYSPVGYGFDPAAVSASVVKNDFIGNGVQVAFVLSASPSTILATNIFINGVYQEKDSYTLSGNTITFSIAPPLNSSIEVLTNETGVINSGNANNISYTAAVTGAVATTVQNKLEEVLSFEDLGAVGDGVTDDGAIINAKIYALYGGLATSQSQQFHEIHGTSGKTYLFATPVTVRQNRIRFIGNGATINCTGAYAFDITQDGSSNGNEEGTISNWKITGATTAAIRGRACNFWHITDNWITGNAIGIDVNGVEVEISNNYIKSNSSFGVVVQSAILVGGGVGESQRCIISTNRIWSNGNIGLYLIDGGGHFVNGNDLENNFNTQLYIRCSFGNFINGLYSEAPGAANLILIDNVAALAVGRTSDNNQIIGGTFGGGATNDIQIVGGNNTIIVGVRYGAGNVVIGAACNNTTLLQQASPPAVSNNGATTTDLSQTGISKWYTSSFARIIMDATLAAGGAIGSVDNTLRHYGVAGLSANQNLPRNFVGYVDITGAATSGTANFPANEPSAAYGIQLTVLDTAGTPSANSHIAYATNRTAAGFTINLVAAPGTSNTVRVHWLIVQQ